MGDWMATQFQSLNTLATADPIYIANNSETVQPTLFPNGTIEIRLKPMAGKYINVSTIQSWMGFASNANTVTPNGIYNNEIDWGGAAGESLNFLPQALNDNQPIFMDNQYYMTNSDSTIPIHKIVKSVKFYDTLSGADLTTSANEVRMVIEFYGVNTLCGLSGCLPGENIELDDMLNTNKRPVCAIPVPIFADNDSTNQATTGTTTHRFSLWIDEVGYIDSDLANPQDGVSGQYVPNGANLSVGPQLTMTDMSSLTGAYNAYDWDAAGGLGSAASDGPLTSAALQAALSWSGKSIGLRADPGRLHRLTIEGTWASGATAVHKFKYDLNGATVDGVATEIVAFDLGAGSASTIADQAQLDALGLIHGGPISTIMMAGSNTSQVGTFTIEATGTFSATGYNHMTAIEFEVKYTGDPLLLSQTDADFYTDPLYVSPGRPGRSVIYFRKKII